MDGVMGHWVATFWQWLIGIWQLALANPAAIGVLGLLVALLQLLLPNGFGGLFQFLRQQKRTSQPLSDASPFDKIEPYSVTPEDGNAVVRRLLGSDRAQTDPLADPNIPYQQRVNGRDIATEITNIMEHHLNAKQRWVLVLGRSGLGKSREAAQVAQRLNSDGWTVLKLRTRGWDLLSRPDAKALETFGESKLLFFLDDVNRMIPLERGQVDIIWDEGMAKLSETHPLDRLLEFLEGVE